LSCADSRISPEYAFDSGRGDLFVARVAGNFANPNNIASFEYAVEVLKTPLLMVLGHDNCGAIKATISALKDNTTYPGHIPSLIDALSPAVKVASALNGDLLYNSTRENVKQNVEVLKNSGPILSAAIKENKLKIIGAVYRLKTGEIELVS
jgi:carbonic anhydrase